MVSGDDMRYAKAGDVITVVVETSELVLGSIEVSLEVADLPLSEAVHGNATVCSMLGLVSCGNGDSADTMCATGCGHGVNDGCRGGVCVRTMTVSAEPVRRSDACRYSRWLWGQRGVCADVRVRS